MTDFVKINGNTYSVNQIEENCLPIQDIKINNRTKFKVNNQIYVSAFFCLNDTNYFLFVHKDNPSSRWCEPVREGTTWLNFVESQKHLGNTLQLLQF